MNAKKRPSLADFAVGQASASTEGNQAATQPKSGPRTRGKGDRVAVAVRLGQEDWRRLHEYALHQGKSLQAIIIEGIQAHMQAAGVRPISDE